MDAWTRLWAPLLALPVVAMAGVGLILSFSGDDTVEQVMRVGVAAVMGGVVHLGWVVNRPGRPPVSAWRGAAATALTYLALAGAVHVGGPAVPVVLACGAGAVALHLWTATRRTMPGTPEVRSLLSRPDIEVLAAVLPKLTLDELCQTWSAAGADLARTHSPERATRLLTLREALLVELERRDPGGVGRWLNSASAADSGPRGFLSEEEPPRAA